MIDYNGVGRVSYTLPLLSSISETPYDLQEIFSGNLARWNQEYSELKSTRPVLEVRILGPDVYKLQWPSSVAGDCSL